MQWYEDTHRVAGFATLWQTSRDETHFILLGMANDGFHLYLQKKKLRYTSYFKSHCLHVYSRVYQNSPAREMSFPRQTVCVGTEAAAAAAAEGQASETWRDIGSAARINAHTHTLDDCRHARMPSRRRRWLLFAT